MVVKRKLADWLIYRELSIKSLELRAYLGNLSMLIGKK